MIWDADRTIRQAVFAWLTRWREEQSETIPRYELERWQLGGRRIPLVGPSGIFKPAVCDLPISVVYHDRSAEPFGAETRPSLLLYRDLSKPYMVDYAFVPRSWLGLVQRFELGDPGEWLTWSDHVPIVLDLAV